MGIQKTEKIWHNGKLINWDDATLHVMSHVVHYGSSVFEGIRCYELPTGPAIFRADEHMQRLLDSAKVYRMDVAFTKQELVAAMQELMSTGLMTVIGNLFGLVIVVVILLWQDWLMALVTFKDIFS